MKPTAFPEATETAMGGDRWRVPVEDLPTYRDGYYTISCWQADWRERLRILVTGRVWLSVITGESGPQPASVLSETPFLPSAPVSLWRRVLSAIGARA